MAIDRRNLVALSLASLVAQPGDLLSEQEVYPQAKPYRIWRTIEFLNGTFYYSNPDRDDR